MSTSIPTTCAAVTDALMRESGRLTDGMFQRAALVRPIIRLQSKTRGEFKLGAGISQSSVRFERSFSPFNGGATTDPWTVDGASPNMAASDGADVNGCRPQTDSVAFTQKSFTITPKQYALQTEDFCIRDIMTGWQFAEWMSKVSRALEFIPTWVWARRFTYDYVAMTALATGSTTGHLVTLNQSQGIQLGSTYNTTNIANGRLRQPILDYFYAIMMREGAANPSGTDEATGSPVFTLITSAETSMDIIRSDPDLRNDVRYAYMGKGEMTPLVPGVPFKKKNYGGFIHEIDPYPRRFTVAGGAYQEVPPFVVNSSSSSLNGRSGWELNPAYNVAPIEESLIWHEGVYRDLAVNTAENLPANWNFQPRSWMGSFSPRNILDRTCNPDGLMIFFRALFASAAEPLDPNLGYSILAARCATDTTVRSCYSS